MPLHCAYVRARCAHDDRSKSHRGFALVIALSVMALVLLLVLSITTLIQVETSSAQAQLKTLKARETARLGLAMAIGQLERYASNDQRVTARAELLGNETIYSGARFWTGVWDTTDMDEAPVWLVSGKNVDARTKPTASVRLVGPGTVGEDTSQYVYVPTVEVFNSKGNLSSRLGWWISDEGVKTSVASLPLHERPIPNFLNEDDALQLQLASTHGLEAIFDKYDRFSANCTKVLDRVSSINQLNTLEKFNESVPDTSREALFHTLTLNSCGLLTSTTGGGLMQDLSLFPELLGPGLRSYLQLGETHANLLAAKKDPIAKKLLFTNIIGLEDIGNLQNGDIATPIIPVLSSFMIAFTIRSLKSPAENAKFLLRARFFCEFWNPYTHTLSMADDKGQPVDLELEITGFPEVVVHGEEVINVDGVHETVYHKSNPINLQTLMKDPKNEDNAVVIRLVNDPMEPWLPGRSKNWVGIDHELSDPACSPYKSTDTKTKRWDRNDRTLGGTDGINTGEPAFAGKLRHKSSEEHTLRIKVYQVTSSSRKLVSDLNGFLYEPVSTSAEGYENDHKGMTFGYHIMLREPNNSYAAIDFFRGLWLKDHDPRSPVPMFRNDWHLNNNIEENTGSPYVAVVNGLEEISPPEPQKIHEDFNSENTIDSNRFERLLDRSKFNGNSLDELWQDAPLFELPRKRVLSLASLQHVYMHNERPFQVGNSWGSQGRYNTSEWFDRYFFSGLSRDDRVVEFNRQAGPTNPCLQFENMDSLLARFPLWQEASPDDVVTAREPARYLMVANRFNINSTSIDAWKAVLSSLRLGDFSHLYWPDENTSDLNTLHLSQDSGVQGSFTRFSHSLEETYQAPASPVTNGTADSAFYRHGTRRFSSGEFEVFAQEIVRLIKQRGMPFQSMEEFISGSSTGDGSLLEQAIKNVFTDPVTKRQRWYHGWETSEEDSKSESPTDIDHFSPGFLTQADILTAIGPMLAPRSDTFKIRVLSSCLDDFGELAGTAAIEAVLQRMPEASDATAPPGISADREWKLISMCWLQGSEI